MDEVRTCVDLEQMRANYRERKAALEARPPAERAYVVRVVAGIEENVRHRGRSGRWHFAADETVDRLRPDHPQSGPGPPQRDAERHAARAVTLF